MERGGYSMIRGARFQHLWAVRQFLQVLAETVRSVRIEPAGLEGEGVDLIVELENGRIEYQQCKRSQGQAGKWTLNALASNRVLDTIGARLRANPEASFRLVSVDSAPALRELAASARASLNPASFEQDQVRASEARTKAFSDFCRGVGLDLQNKADLTEARDLLCRTFVTVVGDDEGDLRDLASHARYWVDGDPETVIRKLEAWSQEKLRCSVTGTTIRDFLLSEGLPLRNLARDPRILPAILELQESFESSLTPQLIQGELLNREETGQILEFLDAPSRPKFLALHGSKGVGKSGVLLGLTKALREKGIPYLPLRLDRQRPNGTTRQFGESLGLPESPALCLNAISGNQGAVLILDQLDALGWTSERAAQAFETCRRLVKEIKDRSGLRVVASCRTFDLEEDSQIRNWVAQQEAKKIEVGPLSADTVREIVSSVGIKPSALNEKQLDLLRTIQLLRAWEEYFARTGKTGEFGSEWELLDELWRSRVQEALRMGIQPTAMREVLDSIVTYMDEHSTLVAPRRLVLAWPDVERVLLSLNVLLRDGNGLSFWHQTYFDHQLAIILLHRIDESRISVEEWLTGGHQGLFRRDQLRLILSRLREERSDEYIAVVRVLVESSSLRFHLKQVVLQSLGQVPDPSPAEIKFALALLLEERWKEHVVADILFGHSPWFEAAHEAGVLQRWLEQGDRERDSALGLIRAAAAERGELCHGLLDPLTNRGGEWRWRVATALPWEAAKDSPSLFELRVRLAEEGIGQTSLAWSDLGGPNFSRLVRLVQAQLVFSNRREVDSLSQAGIFYGVQEANLDDVNFAELLEAWDRLVPQAGAVLGLEVEGEEPFHLEHSSGALQLLELLRKIAMRLLSLDGQEILAWTDKKPTRLSELLVLEALASEERSEIAERALEWLMSRPHRLRLRWEGNDIPWVVAARAVGQLTKVCPPEVRGRFEGFLLGFREPQLLEDMEYRNEWRLSPHEGEPQFVESSLARPSLAGQTAFHLLPAMPKNLLSPKARGRLLELRRKFAKVEETFFSVIGKGQGGTVGSPLPSDQLNALSDKTWLEIVCRNALARPSARWHRRYREGCFEESTPESFSADLRTATAEEPGRFARLVIQFPADANALYFGAVVEGLRAEARKDLSGQDTTCDELEAVFALPQVRSDPTLARSLARLVESRASFDWSPSTLSWLAQIAVQHADPPPDAPSSVGNDEGLDPRDLISRALNSTRGVVTGAIAKLLFADTGRFQAFHEAINRLVADPHPAVRAAVLECCLAILEVDPNQAIAWALKAAGDHEVLLACRPFEHFLRFASHRAPERTESTLLKMLGSEHEVAKAGARLVAEHYLLTGRMEKAALGCLTGTVEKRTGAAQMVAVYAKSPEHHEKARAMLLDLVNDDADEVLKACTNSIARGSLDHFSEAQDFLDAFASSRAFQAYPRTLLFRLHDHSGDLLPYSRCILKACSRLSETALPESYGRQPRSVEADLYLLSVLLRLYDQAEKGSKVRELCLDACDALLQARVLSASRFAQKLDSL